MTFERDDGRPILQARADPEMVERVEEFADAHDVSKSEVIRRSIKHYLPEAETVGPEDPGLREVYHWLRERTDPSGYVSTSIINDLAQQQGMAAEHLKEAKLRPLANRAWIDPKHTKIRVLEPDERDQLRPNPTNE